MRRAVFFALLAAGGAAAPGNGWALEGCTCGTLSLPARAVFGSLSAVTGTVTVGGLAAVEGTQVPPDMQVLTIEDSSATLSVGGCGLDLGAGYSASISMTGPDVCVEVFRSGELVRDRREVLPGETVAMSTQAAVPARGRAAAPAPGAAPGAAPPGAVPSGAVVPGAVAPGIAATAVPAPGLMVPFVVMGTITAAMAAVTILDEVRGGVENASN